MLSDLKQLNSVTHAIFSCIEVVFKVGPFSVYNINKITDCFGSIGRLKRNRMKWWKTLQRVYKCSLASSKGWRKSQSQINCTGLWESFRIWWKKWWFSFGAGWKVAGVRIHPSSSGWICDWWVGPSQVHLCWLSNGESDYTEEQNWRFQKWIWGTSSDRYPRARSSLRAWYSLCNLTDLWLVSATIAKKCGDGHR